MNKGFSNPTNLTQFFINPDSQLKIEIENELSEKYKEIIESELYVRELKPFYDIFISNFSGYKQEIENEAKKEKKFTEDQFIQEKEKERIGLINDKKDTMNKLIEDYKKIYDELNEKIENSVLIKVNDILRKIISFANKNSSIDDLIENNNKLVLDEFDKINDLIEGENDNRLKTNILNLINELKECNAKLDDIKEYNKYQELYNKLIRIRFQTNYGI